MSIGFVMISRELMEGELYFSERFTRSQAYTDLCLLASYRERSFFIRGNKVTIKPGQLAKSEDELAERWKWSRNTVRKFLNEQQECGNIELQKSRIITIITVNFGLTSAQQDEQQNVSFSEQQNEQQFAQQIEQLTRIIDNNKKEIEKLKKENIPPYIPQGGNVGEVFSNDTSEIEILKKNISSLTEECRKLREENEKLKTKRTRFVKPTIEEVSAYINEKGYHFDPVSFVSFYESKGWMIGKNKMKDWHAACATWERESKDRQPQEEPQKTKEEEWPVGLAKERWEKFVSWGEKKIPRIYDKITPRMFMKMQPRTHFNTVVMADVLVMIDKSDFDGDLLKEFERISLTPEVSARYLN